MNTKVRFRTLEDNNVVLIVIYPELEIALAQCTDVGDMYWTGLTEHKLFRQTSAILIMDLKEFRRLYYSFTYEETGRMLDIFRLVYYNALRGKGSPNYKFHGKIPNIFFLHTIKCIDTKHVKVNKVACREILNWIQRNCALYCSNHTLSQYMLYIGLSYNPSKPEVCNNNIASIDQIRD